MPLIERLHRANAEGIADREDPWRRMLKRALAPDVVCISSVGLVDLLGVAPSTGNCRRLALSMRALGWVAIKSRRLTPGGWRSSECRGWTRSFREPRKNKPCGPTKRYEDEGVHP